MVSAEAPATVPGPGFGAPPMPSCVSPPSPRHPLFPPRLQTLSGMSASDELDDSQVRQMLFDLESAYNAFNRFLHS